MTHRAAGTRSGGRRRRPAWLAIALAVAVGPVVTAAQGEIIDRVLAVVEGTVITQSDVDAAIALGLVEGVGALDGGALRDAVLERLIDRQLTLREVRRYLPPEPAQAAVAAAVQRIRDRFASPEAFARALTRYGFDERRLTDRVRDDLRIDAYLDERFVSVAQPTGEEVAAYYYANLDQFTRNGQLQPLQAVLETIRARLAARRRNAMIDDWLAGLRRRADVTEPASSR